MCFGSGVDACDCKVPAVRHWRRSGKELIVFRLVLGTIVCLFTARIDCFSLFFFKDRLLVGGAAPTGAPATVMGQFVIHLVI
jgi:hypothetical protein